MSFLSAQISNCHKIIRGIEESLFVQMEFLMSEVCQEDVEDLTAHAWRERDLTTIRCKQSQKRKFKKLFERSQRKSDAPRHWVVDLSRKGLEAHERELLERRLKYAVNPKQIPIKSLIASAEDGKGSKSGPEVELVLLNNAGILANAKPPKPNLPSLLRHSIKTLRERSEVTCLPE